MYEEARESIAWQTPPELNQESTPVFYWIEPEQSRGEKWHILRIFLAFHAIT